MVSDSADTIPPFSNEAVNRGVLRERAYNHRWAEQPDDVIPLTAADPDFPAPPAVREAILNYARAGYFSYGPADGLPEFRETVSEVAAERKNIYLPADHVLPIDGAARAMFLLARAALNPGDEAIIFDPVDFLFKKSVEAADGVPIFCPVDPRTGTFDSEQLESLVTPRTRMLGVCNPHNPTGRVLRKNEIQALAEFACRHDLWVMNDEIWSDIIYPHDHIRFHSMHSLPAELTGKYALERLSRMNGIRCSCPEGTYVLFPDITELGLSSRSVTERLLREARVAVVPGTSEYLGPGSKGSIRICFATSYSILNEALDRIESWTERL